MNIYMYAECMFGKFTIVISVKYTLQHCQVLSINTLTRQGAIAPQALS